MKPFDKRHNQATLNSLAEQGIEMTPDELEQERTHLFATVRRSLREKGWAVPESDEELFLLMCEAMNSSPGDGAEE